MVRELGSERRETVRTLSGGTVEFCRELASVREDQAGGIPGVPVVTSVATPGSYIPKG